MASFVLDLGNDLDLLNAAVIKAEHLKYVLHHCSSIDKCSIAQKKASHSHITLFPRRGAECVWETVCCTLSAKHGNLCSHSGCLSETKRTGQLGKLETAASICTVMKTRWAGRAGRSRRWHSRWRKGRSAAASSGCYGENGGEMRGDRAAVSKVKGDWIILQQVASTPRPHIQVMNSAGTHRQGNNLPSASFLCAAGKRPHAADWLVGSAVMCNNWQFDHWLNNRSAHVLSSTSYNNHFGGSRERHEVEISPLYSISIYILYKNYLHLIHFFKIQAAKQHTNQIQNYKISYIYHLPFLK